MPVNEPWSAERAAEIIAEAAKQEGACMPILHALQRAFGYVPREALPMVATALNLSRAEVHGVFSFYHDFRDHPAGRHEVKLCRAEACQAMGAGALHKYAKDKLHLAWHETTTDGKITLEPVFCLGLCFRGPAAMIDGKVYAGLDNVSLGKLLDRARTA
jgi:formate dehydrogenase subunit gamma